MVATYNDSYVLSTDTTFQNRVRSALIHACVLVEQEGWDVPFHQERETFAAQAMNSPDTYKTIFTNSISTDTNVLNDATEGGTVVITDSNKAAQAALVADGDIANAVWAQFNTFFRTPG